MLKTSILKNKMPLLFATSIMLTACATGPYGEDLSIQQYPTLEVIKTSDKGNHVLNVQMIDLQTHRKYTAYMSPKTLGDTYVHLKQGDRVKIAGTYQAGRTVPIANITQIIKLANPDKTQCESGNNVWQPMGALQVPTCVSK